MQDDTSKSTDASAALSQPSSQEQADQLAQRIIKMSELVCTVREALKNGTKIDEAFDLHVLIASKCQKILESAQLLFPNYGDFRAFLKTSPPFQDVVSQALSCDRDDPDRYTRLSHWVGEWLNESGGYSEESLPEELSSLKAYSNTISTRFGRMKPLYEFIPDLFHDGRFRDYRIMDLTMQHRIFSFCIKLLKECEGNEKAFIRAAGHLDEYQATSPESHQALVAKLQESLKQSIYAGLEPMREKIMGTLIPDKNECSPRAWRVLSALSEGRACSEELMSDTIEAIKLNTDFWRQDFPIMLHMALSDLPNQDPGDSIQLVVDQKALNQFRFLMKTVGMTASETLTRALSIVADIHSDATPNLTDPERVVLLMQAYETNAQKHFDPRLEKHDMHLYLLFKDAPEDVLVAASGVGDISATIVYTVTGDAKYLSGIRNARHGERLMAIDLGL